MDLPNLSFKDHLRESRLFTSRALISAVGLTLMLVILVAQMFRLQVVEHEKYRTQSTENRVKIRPLAPTRGQIFDRNGVPLAVNRLTYTLEVIPQRTRDFDKTLTRLREILTITDDDIERYQKLKRQLRRFDNVPLRINLDPSEVARFAVKSHLFSNVVINAVPTRNYPLKSLAGHIVGYVGRISDKDLERIDASNYSGTSHIGKSGLEKSYEEQLHGRVGLLKEEVNAAGRPLRILERTPPDTGRDLQLHLDTRVQEVALSAFGEFNGAAVAIEVETGGIIAMVSKPGFDPNLFVDGISSKKYKSFLQDPNRPLYNRALKGLYPPASTIKPFLGWAGLVSHTVTPDSATVCRGYFQLPKQSHKYRCWNKWGHGSVNLLSAITTSCDVYFYSLASDMGIDLLDQYLAPFGFGRPTGIDLLGENGGILPSRAWKERVHKKPWYPGETVIAGIGQGYFLSTPLQLANATATFAAGGKHHEPRLVATITAPDQSAAPVTISPKTVHFDMSVGNYHQQIVYAMTQVIEAKKGTAKGIQNENYRIAGKTGTAQVFSIKQDATYQKGQVREKLRDHALFIAFAPVESPKIAVAIIAEHGESGGKIAAPIAKKIMDAYLLGATYDELDDADRAKLEASDPESPASETPE